MKTLALTLVLALACAAPALAAPQEDAALEKTLAGIAAAHHGRVGLYAENLKTGEVAVLNPDEDAPTASVIKLTALYEAMVEIRAGKARFDDPLTLTKDNQVTGSGILGQFDTPHALTFKDALTLMVVVSDNTATNLVIDHLGLAAINARTRSLGLTHTVFYKKLFKPIEGSIPPEQPKFGLGRTTPREMAQVMRRIARCDLGTPGGTDDKDRAICAVTLTMLRNQFYRDGIPRYIEALDSSENGSAIANKTGAIDDARNDVAAIATKNGTVILSVFTHDNKDHGWSADDEGDVTIAKLAKAVVEAWSPRGLDVKNGF
ncbi:MAG TPA: serine hydrolase [Caulobacteraceae bacterium]|jgi:beta-lactamase class A|nr:serine hydrolase [Caulobacteraceae bacterium]